MMNDKMMTLANWVDYIQQFHPDEINLGLERARTVAERLQLNLAGKPVIMVAGTNGKGSTIKLMQTICLAHGLTPAVYTSPHIHQFNERIVIGDSTVSDSQIIQAFEVVEAARQQSPVIPLTFFEFTTLAAFYLFQINKGIDVCLLEVGLGGRLDVVNLIDADIAVITSIGFDHQDYIGHTREAIGYEKVGIARKGRPLVMGDTECPEMVQKKINELEALPFYQTKDYQVIISDHSSEWVFQGEIITNTVGYVPLSWSFQLPAQLPWLNVATALQALCLWRNDWQIDKLEQAVHRARLIGRCQQMIWQGHSVILDVGHNPAAIIMLIKQANFQLNSLSIVLGMLSDKDVKGVIKLLKPYIKQWLVCDLPTSRNLGVDNLIQLLHAQGISSHSIDSFNTPHEALIAAERYYNPILVTGSFYTVADVLSYLTKNS